MDVVEIGLLALSVLLVIGGGGVGIAATRPAALRLADWREEGLLSAEQADELERRHAAHAALDRRERAAKALGILGAAALGAGVILFFAANWSEIPRALRIAVLLAGLTLFYGAGFYLLEVRRAYRNVGHAAVFVAAILFGASVFLVGQMYHVQAHDPFGFLVWSAGALATALFFRSKPAAGLFVLTFEAWLIHELIDYDDTYQVARFIPFVLALYGLALYAVGTGGGLWLERLALAGAMRVVGFSIAGFMLFVLSFRYVHGAFGDDATPDGVPRAIVIGSAAAALAGAALLALRRPRPWSMVESLFVAGATALVLLAAFAPEETGGGEFLGDAKRYPLLFAALLVVLVAGGVLVGSLNDEAWLANGAISLGALALLAHFLDVAWSRLPRSLVLMAVGLGALVVAAVVEWRRRLLAAGGGNA